MLSLITSQKFKSYLTLSAMLVIGNFFQHTDNFQLFGIKVNFIFAILGIAPIFLETIGWYLLFIFPALFIMSMPLPISFEILKIGGLGITFFYLNRWLRWRTFLNSCLLIILGIIFFYLMVDPVFLGTHTVSVALEIGSTIAMGGIMYVILRII
ncbi:MAG TPA: hypothetical protein VJH70_00700 [Candidatus Paceibacterota bacterium]